MKSRFKYTKHALEKIKRRGITKKKIREVVLKAQSRITQENRKIKATYTENGNKISVIYRVKGNVITIITTFYGD